MAKSKSKSTDDAIDLYSLTDNLSAIEEIDQLATSARAKKKSINKLELEYKSISKKFKDLLYAHGKPQKVNGGSWTANKETRTTISINRDRLQERLLQERGMKIEKVLEIIEYATDVDTTEYYVLRGVKGQEEAEQSEGTLEEQEK